MAKVAGIMGISEALELPSPAQLLEIPAHELISVRCSDVAMDYFTARDEWQESPSEERATVLLDSLAKYSAEITAVYLKYGRPMPKLLSFLRVDLPLMRSGVGQIVTKILSELTEVFLSPIGVISSVGDTIASSYCFLPSTARDWVNSAIGVTRKVEFQFDPDRELLSVPQNASEALDGAFT